MKSDKKSSVLERAAESFLYSTRWILAPMYIGLSIILLILAIKFFQELIHIIPNIFTITEGDLVLITLSLIDMALVGGLLVMVMFSSYENFVSQIDIDDSREKLNWLGKVDAASLKNKVAASIVAISSIHLLKIFMNVEKLDNDKIFWYTMIHMAFVVSAFAMGYLDKITRDTKH